MCDPVLRIGGLKFFVHIRPECNSMIAKWIDVDCGGSAGVRVEEQPARLGRQRSQI